ncbi:MAG: hypothetical protein ACREVN_09425 [Gammaproteobacteria bacterium]
MSTVTAAMCASEPLPPSFGLLKLERRGGLAALAVEHSGEVYSADYDFQRFPGVTHVDPLS